MNPTTRRIASLLLFAALVLLASPAFAQDYNDGHGKIWRQNTQTTGLTYQQVATVCPVDGETPGTGSVNGIDFTGWVWATSDQVITLFSYWEPAILKDESLNGAQYTFSALMFTSTFQPTEKFHINTFSSQATRGFTSTIQTDGMIIRSSVGAQWPAFNGFWASKVPASSTVASSTYGVWLWKPVPCEADITGDGVVNVGDLLTVISAWGECSQTTCEADIDHDLFVNVSDLLAVIGAWGGCL